MAYTHAPTPITGFLSACRRTAYAHAHQKTSALHANQHLTCSHAHTFELPGEGGHANCLRITWRSRNAADGIIHKFDSSRRWFVRHVYAKCVCACAGSYWITHRRNFLSAECDTRTHTQKYARTRSADESQVYNYRMSVRVQVAPPTPPENAT